MSKKKTHSKLRIRNGTAEFLTFAYQTGGDGVEIRVQDGTIWLSQKNMGELFETSPDNIGLHLKNVYADGELSESATTEDFSVVRNEGGRFGQTNRYHFWGWGTYCPEFILINKKSTTLIL